LLIRYNDGAGGFDVSDEVAVGTADELRFALASADLDRNGQPDFISGSAAGDNLILSLNNLPDEPVLADEMFVTGYDNVDVSVTNPPGFVISRSLQTVAGSAYYRLHVDSDDLLDVRTYDYNLQYGEYRLTASPAPGGPANVIAGMGIGINGSLERCLAQRYTLPMVYHSGVAAPLDTFVFYFEVEETSSIQPPNGLATPDTRPTFDWSLRAVKDTVRPPYRFQMHRYHDFSEPPFIYDIAGLTSPQFTPDTFLQPDSIYYWRFLSSSDEGLSYQDTSRTFAAYIVASCCVGRVGDANGAGGDEPTIGDVSTMIDAKFITGSCDGIIGCLSEADINQSGGTDPTCDDITIGDISTLIDYLFITGQELGLPNCL